MSRLRRRPVAPPLTRAPTPCGRPKANGFARDVIFNFNGAEETFLQAAHGFATGHPWGRDIVAFVNMEAVGGGGPSIIFQAGPRHAWLTRLLARELPHPHATVLAQDIFVNELVPSDTDFRIYRDFAGAVAPHADSAGSGPVEDHAETEVPTPGVDMAFYHHGHVYHTAIDDPRHTSAAALQHMGDNAFAALRALASLPDLPPPAADVHAAAVFFDVFGLTLVSVPAGAAHAAYGLVTAALFLSLRATPRGMAHLAATAPIALLATVVPVLTGAVVGVLAHLLLGVFMPWYATSWLGVAMYAPFALLGALLRRALPTYRPLYPQRPPRPCSRSSPCRPLRPVRPRRPHPPPVADAARASAGARRRRRLRRNHERDGRRRAGIRLPVCFPGGSDPRWHPRHGAAAHARAVAVAPGPRLRAFQPPRALRSTGSAALGDTPTSPLPALLSTQALPWAHALPLAAAVLMLVQPTLGRVGMAPSFVPEVAVGGAVGLLTAVLALPWTAFAHYLPLRRVTLPLAATGLAFLLLGAIVPAYDVEHPKRVLMHHLHTYRDVVLARPGPSGPTRAPGGAAPRDSTMFVSGMDAQPPSVLRGWIEAAAGKDPLLAWSAVEDVLDHAHYQVYYPVSGFLLGFALRGVRAEPRIQSTPPAVSFDAAAPLPGAAGVNVSFTVDTGLPCWATLNFTQAEVKQWSFNEVRPRLTCPLDGPGAKRPCSYIVRHAAGASAGTFRAWAVVDKLPLRLDLATLFVNKNSDVGASLHAAIPAPTTVIDHAGTLQGFVLEA